MVALRKLGAGSRMGAAAHVEAEAKMKDMRDEGHDISTCIENLRPTCASCNGGMRTFNLFSFIDVVGDFMTAEMEKWMLLVASARTVCSRTAAPGSRAQVPPPPQPRSIATPPQAGSAGTVNG